MRVVIDYRAALRRRSGVGEYAHQLAVALLKARAAAHNGGQSLEVRLFSSSWKDRLIVSSDLAGASAVDRRVPVRALNYAWHRLGWPAAELLVGSAFDVAHSLHPLLMPTRDAAQVVTIHDLHFLDHPERTRHEIRRDYPALARAHAQRADRIVAVSQYTAEQAVSQLGVPPDRISICSIGAPSWEPRFAPPASEGYVLFVGTLEPRKNLGVLLDAYEILAGRRRDLPPLVIAGQPTEQAHEWLERTARTPLAGRVRHVGYVDPEKRRDLYAGALALVQPSFDEGFGITILEAMTVGVPVIISNRGALPEVAGNAGTLIDPESPEQVAAAIERIVDHSDVADQAAALGLARARAYSAERLAADTLAAYEAALARRRERAGRP